MFFDSVAYAMGAPAGQEGGGGFGMFVPLILMFGIFYFLLIRPQQKKAKQHKEMLSSLKVGDEVLTGGGLYGRISEINQDILTIELSDNLKVKVNRGFISTMTDASGKVPEK